MVCKSELLLVSWLMCEVDDVITDLIGERDDISLGLDHVNKAKNLWGKADSIFIK